jgi:ICP0-binding domain of Ubiquitin-specific protease 7
MENRGIHSSVVSYYDSLRNCVLVDFKPKDENSGTAEFSLTLRKEITYAVVGTLSFQRYTV